LSESPALKALRDAAGVLATGDARDATLQAILDPLAKLAHAGSAAVFIANPDASPLEIVASVGLDGPGATGLTAAVANPAHPVARTASDGMPAYDVYPMAPGGPALRAHLPLQVGRDGRRRILGVLALAYDQPLDPEARLVAEAAADIMAVAIDRATVRARP
jgi:GAF domain-containing protein